MFNSLNTGAGQIARSAKAENDIQQQEIERLLMITEALWEFIKDGMNLTDEQLMDKINEIDLRDGDQDGKVAKKPIENCTQCDRPLLRNKPFCLYCGATVDRSAFER